MLGVQPEAGARLAGQSPPLRPRRFGGQGVDRGAQILGPFAGEGDDFNLAIPADLRPRRPVLFEHAMEIGAAEAERAHAGPPGMRLARQPGTLARVDVKGRFSRRQFVHRLGDFDGGRQYFMPQSQRGFNDARHAGGGFGVADLRFHRAQRHPGALGLRRAKDRGKRLRFGRVPHFGARAVGFDQVDGIGRDLGRLIGPFQRLHLPFGARRVNGVAPPVARGANAFDHRVNSVSIPLGVRQTFDDEHAHAFADDRTVAVPVEGLRIPRGRQGGGFAEAHEHENIVERVDPAGDDHVRLARRQFQASLMQRRHRAGASGIHHAIRPAQVEPAGDAPGRHIAQQTGERILLPADVRIGDAFDHVIRHRFDDAGFLQRLAPNGVAKTRPERNHQFERAGDPQDHAGFGTIEGFIAVTGVHQSLFGGQHPEQLGGIGRLDVLGGNPKFHRVEIYGR